jgi:hypothetical protein
MYHPFVNDMWVMSDKRGSSSQMIFCGQKKRENITRVKYLFIISVLFHFNHLSKHMRMPLCLVALPNRSIENSEYDHLI